MLCIIIILKVIAYLIQFSRADIIHQWSWLNIGSSNVLAPSDDKSLPGLNLSYHLYYMRNYSSHAYLFKILLISITDVFGKSWHVPGGTKSLLESRLSHNFNNMHLCDMHIISMIYMPCIFSGKALDIEHRYLFQKYFSQMTIILSRGLWVENAWHCLPEWLPARSVTDHSKAECNCLKSASCWRGSNVSMETTFKCWFYVEIFAHKLPLPISWKLVSP